MMRIILENGGTVDDLNGIIKNQDQSSNLNNSSSAAHSSVPAKSGLKKGETLKKTKEQQYAQSKTALSKRLAELERKNREDEKKMESLKHKYD